MIKALTLHDYVKGRDQISPLSSFLYEDALTMVRKANELLDRFGQYRSITSGYRPWLTNKKIPNAAPHSNHIVCRACDLKDSAGDLDRFCVIHQDFLEELGLWLESPTDTPGWTHIQIVPPLSGHRIFIA